MRIVLSVGESSGDYLAAKLASDLKKHCPDIELAGLTGPRMIEQGVKPWFDMDELNVMGLQEVVAHLPRLMRLRAQFREKIIAWKPDAFIGIDAPDFNLGLAKQLKSQGLKTFHYVSPSIWAWRPGRARGIAQALDHLLTLFPFEPSLYQPFGLDAVCVGHPLADDITELLGSSDSNTNHDFEAPTIALGPGSRASEIQRHATVLADAAKLIKTHKPKAKLIMPLAQKNHQALLLKLTNNRLLDLDIQWVINDTQQALRQADVAITASGTVTLETFLMGCPQVVFYRLANLTYALAKGLCLVNTDHIALPNILAKQPLVDEFIQAQASPENLSEAALGWLEDQEKRAHYQAVAEHWRGVLLAQDRAARAVLEG